MQGMTLNTDEMLFDLDQFKLRLREDVDLTAEQQDELRRLPKAERESRAEKMMAEKVNQRKEKMRRLIVEFEDKVRSSGLPSEAIDKILAMTKDAQDKKMVLPYDIEQLIREAERTVEVEKARQTKQQAQETEKKKDDHTDGLVAGVVAGAVLGPFIQVRFDKEEYERRSHNYYETKIADRLVSGVIKDRPAVPEYQVKQGAQYSRRNDRMIQDQRTELQDAIARDIQARQKAAGKSVQDKETILNNLAKMYPMQQKMAENAAYQADPQMKARHETQKKEVAAQDALNGLLRQTRKSKSAALKILEAQRAKLAKEPRTPETAESIARRLTEMDTRIALRRKETMALGLFVDNFEKALKQNNTTASQLLDVVTVDGRRHLDILTDQVSILDMAGLTLRQKQEQQKQVEKAHFIDHQMKLTAQNKGISERLKADSEKIVSQPERAKMADMQKEVAERAQGLWQPKQTTKTGEALKNQAKRKVIRPRIRPQSAKEEMAARELRGIIGSREANTQEFVKNAQVQKPRLPQDIKRTQQAIDKAVAGSQKSQARIGDRVQKMILERIRNGKQAA